MATTLAAGLVWAIYAVLGLSRDKQSNKKIIKQKNVEIAGLYQNEQKNKEQALLKVLLNLKDDEFDSFFLEVMSITEGECQKNTGLGLIDALRVYGEANAIKGNKK